MAKIVGLPKLSPTMEEGTLARWAKKEGDAIAIDDLIAEIETDKATMEWRAFDAGVLLKQLVAEGTTLLPDAPVAIIGQKGDDISALTGAPAEAKAPKAEAPKTEAPKAEAPRAETPKTESSGDEARVFASPLVRKIARENDLDLHEVSGSGPRGRIVKRDVDAFLEQGGSIAKTSSATTASPSSIASGGRGEDQTLALSQMRKTIARRLTESKQNVPHFYLTIDVDAEPLSEAREALMKRLEKSGIKEKVSLNDLIIKAVASALAVHPEANASFDNNTIIRRGNVDISVAVAVPDGLLTPVVRNADRKSVLTIAREVRDLAERARNKKLKPEEMTGGTFSVSNLGMFGIEEFSAVINPPEGAILAVGTTREEPVVKNGAIVPGKRMRMTLSCDHRVIDGAVGAQYLKTLKEFVESPISMLL